MNNNNQNGEKIIKDIHAASLNSSMSIDESKLVDEKDVPAKDFRLIFSHENLLKELELFQQMKEKMQKIGQMEFYLEKIESQEREIKNQEKEIKELKGLMQSILN